jgi:hypothetical protein
MEPVFYLIANSEAERFLIPKPSFMSTGTPGYLKTAKIFERTLSQSGLPKRFFPSCLKSSSLKSQPRILTAFQRRPCHACGRSCVPLLRRGGVRVQRPVRMFSSPCYRGFVSWSVLKHSWHPGISLQNLRIENRSVTNVILRNQAFDKHEVISLDFR